VLETASIKKISEMQQEREDLLAQINSKERLQQAAVVSQAQVESELHRVMQQLGHQMQINHEHAQVSAATVDPLPSSPEPAETSEPTMLSKLFGQFSDCSNTEQPSEHPSEQPSGPQMDLKEFLSCAKACGLGQLLTEPELRAQFGSAAEHSEAWHSSTLGLMQFQTVLSSCVQAAAPDAGPVPSQLGALAVLLREAENVAAPSVTESSLPASSPSRSPTAAGHEQLREHIHNAQLQEVLHENQQLKLELLKAKAEAIAATEEAAAARGSASLSPNRSPATAELPAQHISDQYVSALMESNTMLKTCNDFMQSELDVVQQNSHTESDQLLNEALGMLEQMRHSNRQLQQETIVLRSQLARSMSDVQQLRNGSR